MSSSSSTRLAMRDVDSTIRPASRSIAVGSLPSRLRRRWVSRSGIGGEYGPLIVESALRQCWCCGPVAGAEELLRLFFRQGQLSPAGVAQAVAIGPQPEEHLAEAQGVGRGLFQRCNGAGLV